MVAQVAADEPEAADAAPEPLRGLRLTDARNREDCDGGEVKWSARLPDGGWLRAETAWDRRLTEIETDGAAEPRALLERILPTPVLAAAELGRVATLVELEVERGEIKLEASRPTVWRSSSNLPPTAACERWRANGSTATASRPSRWAPA